jgi:hypothetical protein
MTPITAESGALAVKFRKGASVTCLKAIAIKR